MLKYAVMQLLFFMVIATTSWTSEGFGIRDSGSDSPGSAGLVHKHFLPLKPHLNQQSGLCSQPVAVVFGAFPVIFALLCTLNRECGSSGVVIIIISLRSYSH